MDNRGEDKVFWAESKRGNFTVKLAYHAISNHGYNKEDQIWSLASKWARPKMYSYFPLAGAS